MFNNIFKKLNDENKFISMTRQSVCMADDCTAPNEVQIPIQKNETMQTIFLKASRVLPRMCNVIWAIDTGKYILGYIIVDKQCDSTFEYALHISSSTIQTIETLHASYFHSASFLQNKKEDKCCSELPSQYISPLEDVKLHMRQRFLDEVKIEGGSICIWGEWFGRPHDNVHVIKSVQWSINEIIIHFAHDESLYIIKPTAIQNERSSFCIGDAQEIIWTWYDSEKDHTYPHLYVRQYLKKEDRFIFRAEGKRRDIQDHSGILFKPLSNQAVLITT